MEVYTWEHEGLISYEILSKYHFSAKAILDICLKNNKPVEVNFKHEVNYEASNIEEANETWQAYLLKLNEFNLVYHAAHIGYLVKNLVEFEGSFVNEESNQNKYLKSSIQQLIRLGNLMDNAKSVTIEITHKVNGKEFDDYTKLTDSAIISDTLKAAISSQLNSIKQEEHLIPFELLEDIRQLTEPNIDKLKAIDAKLINIKDKAFLSAFTYTVAEKLRNYLNNESPLKHDTAFLTNDQARIIFEVCKFYSIGNFHHEMDYDKINYVKSIFKNFKDKEGIEMALSQQQTSE